MKKLILFMLLTLSMIMSVSAYELVIDNTSNDDLTFCGTDAYQTFFLPDTFNDIYEITGIRYNMLAIGSTTGNYTIVFRNASTNEVLAETDLIDLQIDASTGNNFVNFTTPGVAIANITYEIAFNTTDLDGNCGIETYIRGTYSGSTYPDGMWAGNPAEDVQFSIFYEDSLPPCVEDWQPYFSSCTIGNNQTLLYNDTNMCGTFDDLPGDNSTVSSCNFCTIGYTENEGTCIDFVQTTYYTYDNFGSCCNLTGLDEDCELPSNTTASCTGIHSASDVPAVVIDGGVEFGIQYIAFAPLIALLTLGVFAWRRFR